MPRKPPPLDAAPADAPDSPAEAFAGACRAAGVAPETVPALWSLHCRRDATNQPLWSLEELLEDHARWRDYAASRDGDAAAARRFHDYWSRQIGAFCGGRRLREHRDEIASRFFERTWRLVGREFAWGSPFTAYLRTILVNLSRDLATREARARLREAPIESPDERPRDVASPRANPEEEAISAETVEKVRAAMLELSPGDQHLILGCLVDGESGQDLAARLGIDRNAIYQRLHRARHRLEQRLTDEGVLPAPQGGARKPPRRRK